MGYSTEELLRMQSISSLIAYEDRNEVQTAIENCLRGTTLTIKLSCGITRKNGQLVKVMVQGVRRMNQKTPTIMGIMDSIA